jgi:predicted nucleic acid-binding Zn ribbon protein
VTRASECPACGAAVGPNDQTCQKCGRDLSWTPDEEGVACAVCGTPIRAYTLTCPSCGETGYPALRPRKGKGFKGSPDFESRRSGDA